VQEGVRSSTLQFLITLKARPKPGLLSGARLIYWQAAFFAEASQATAQLGVSLTRFAFFAAFHRFDAARRLLGGGVNPLLGR
jgi:hypothetical protein